MNELADNLDWLITLTLVGIGALFVYFRPRPEGQRRPAWAPPIAFACLVLEVFLIVRVMQHPGAMQGHTGTLSPAPKLVDVQAAFESAAVTATSDVDYRGEGFRVNIPAGYRYAKLSPPMLLMATAGDHAHTMNVVSFDAGTENPDDVVRQMYDKMKAGGKYELSGITESGGERMIWFRTTRNGVSLRGLMVFQSQGEKLWQLTLTGPPSEDDGLLYSLARTWVVE